MPTRIALRRVGAVSGKQAALPATMVELVALAAQKLNMPAKRVFSATGDEYDDDEDLQLIAADEVLYVSCGEDYVAAAAEPRDTVAEPNATVAETEDEATVAVATIAEPAAAVARPVGTVAEDPTLIAERLPQPEPQPPPRPVAEPISLTAGEGGAASHGTSVVGVGAAAPASSQEANDMSADEQRQAAVEGAAVALLAAAMDEPLSRADCRVQMAGALAMFCMVDGSHENGVGILEQMMEKMEEGPPADSAAKGWLVPWSLNCVKLPIGLSYLTREAGCANKARGVNVANIDALVSAMRAHADLPTMQWIGCGLVAQLVGGGAGDGTPNGDGGQEKASQIAVRAGALEAVACALRGHPVDPSVQQSGVHALCALCGGGGESAREVQTLARELGLVRLLEHALHAHSLQHITQSEGGLSMSWCKLIRSAQSLFAAGLCALCPGTTRIAWLLTAMAHEVCAQPPHQRSHVAAIADGLTEHAESIAALSAFSSDGTSAEALALALRDGARLSDPQDVSSAFEPDSRTSRRADATQLDSTRAMTEATLAALVARAPEAVCEGLDMLAELWDGGSDSAHTPAATALIARGVIEATVMAMRMHPAHVGVQAKAAMQISRLGTSNCQLPDGPCDLSAPAVLDLAAEEILSRAEFAGAVEAVVAAMARHDLGQARHDLGRARHDLGRAQGGRGHESGRAAGRTRDVRTEDGATVGDLHSFGAAALIALTCGVWPAQRRQGRLIQAGGFFEMLSKSTACGDASQQKLLVVLLTCLVSGIDEKVRRQFVASRVIEHVVEILRVHLALELASGGTAVTKQCSAVLDELCFVRDQSKYDDGCVQRALKTGALPLLEAAEVQRAKSARSRRTASGQRAQTAQASGGLHAHLRELGRDEAEASLKAQQAAAWQMAEQLLADEASAKKESAKPAKPAKPSKSAKTGKDRAKPATEPPAEKTKPPAESKPPAEPPAEQGRMGSRDISAGTSGGASDSGGTSGGASISTRPDASLGVATDNVGVATDNVGVATDKSSKKKEKKARQRAARANDSTAANSEGLEAAAPTTEHASVPPPAEQTNLPTPNQAEVRQPGTEPAPPAVPPLAPKVAASAAEDPKVAASAAEDLKVAASAADDSTVAASAADDATDDSCIICMEAEKTHAFIPCGHTCTCARCSELVMEKGGTCPYCRAPAMMATRIYGT